MSTHTDKVQENKSQSAADKVYQKQGKAKTGPFADSRPETLERAKLQAIANSSSRVQQFKAYQGMANASHKAKEAIQLQAIADNSFVHQSPYENSLPGVIQMGGKKATKLTVKIPRPGFIGSVDAMREDSKGMYPGENIHMAHRLSWQQIELTLRGGDMTQITPMINNLTIPQRNFGNPAHGGVAKGNLDYYNAVQKVLSKYGPSPELAKALNSSPYNLRPGDGSVNSAIGGDPDAHFDETQPNEPMTPQSKALLPPNTGDSSDFMTMASFQDWEANFYIDYVLPAIASVGKL
jgi:hypothetical protein